MKSLARLTSTVDTTASRLNPPLALIAAGLGLVYLIAIGALNTGALDVNAAKAQPDTASVAPTFDISTELLRDMPNHD